MAYRIHRGLRAPWPTRDNLENLNQFGHIFEADRAERPIRDVRDVGRCVCHPLGTKNLSASGITGDSCREIKRSAEVLPSLYDRQAAMDAAADRRKPRFLLDYFA